MHISFIILILFLALADIKPFLLPLVVGFVPFLRPALRVVLYRNKNKNVYIYEQIINFLHGDLQKLYITTI